MDLSFFPAWPPAWPTAMAVAVLALFAAAAGEVAARWLRLPRLLGYLAAGALFGAGGYVLQLLKIEELPIRTMQFSMNFAAAVILFDVGQRVSFGWVRRNPALLAASVLESGLTFVAVYLVMQAFDIAPLAAALIAAISMSTSPAVVLAVTQELRAQGQVTERTLLLTALNSIYAVVLSTLLLAWARVQTRGVLDDYLLHPAYLIVGSLALAAIGARVFLWVVGLRRPRSCRADHGDAGGRVDRVCQCGRVEAVAAVGVACVRRIRSHFRRSTPAGANRYRACIGGRACAVFRAFGGDRSIAFRCLPRGCRRWRWSRAHGLQDRLRLARWHLRPESRGARDFSTAVRTAADVGAGIDADAGGFAIESAACRADQCGTAAECRDPAGARCADAGVCAACERRSANRWTG